MGRVRASHGGVSRLFASLLLPAALSLPAQQPETPVFATDVRLVTLPVTVKDADGAPVGDLERGDFEILEAGVARRVAVFERRTNRPLSVALMLDTSLSTAIELRYERESASRFLKNLLGRGSHPGDRAAVFSFSADVQVHQRFTRDRRALERALGSMRPESGTSVYDAVRLASGELARREGRRVIVMITDGGDTTSHWRFADALRAAHDHEVAIYPLIVLPIQSDAGRNRGGEHALITLARNTGGETFVQHGAENLDLAFGEVLRNLRTQYLLGFYPGIEGAQTKEVFRTLEIRAAPAGAVVLARSGYYADPDEMALRPRAARDAPTSVRTMPQARGSGQSGSEATPPPAKPKRSQPDGRRRPSIVRPGR